MRLYLLHGFFALGDSEYPDGGEDDILFMDVFIVPRFKESERILNEFLYWKSMMNSYFFC